MAMYFYLVIALCIFSTLTSLGRGSDVPVGHLKPFGSHNMPPEKVDEITVENMPSPEKLWKDYVSIRKPVVFRGAAKQSPALTKWSDEYLKENYGDLEVRIEAKKEKQGYIPVGDKGVGRDTVRNFIDTYHHRNKYIVSELPRQMHEEVMVIPGLACGAMGKRIVEVDWWMNGGSASSIIHKDAFNQINCLMNGTKEWKLIEYKHEKNIYKAWEPEREVGGYSRINPNKVDLVKYPKVSSVPWQFTVLNGGDCLYLPGSMYHQVKSNGTNNFAVSLLFSRFDGEKDLDFSDCSSSSNNFKKLSDFDVDWQYQGNGTMTMGAADLENVRDELLGMSYKKGQLSLKMFYSMMRQMYPEKDKETLKKEVKDTYKKIVEVTGEKLTTEQIMKMPKEALRIVALILQPMDASNTYDHEYTYVRPDGIQDLITAMLDKDGKLTRQSFVDKYQKNLFGTEMFANRIFDDLAGESANTATTEQVNSKISKALHKFYDNQREHPEPPKGEVSTGDAYDETNADTEMHETGMPDMTEDDDTGMPDMTDGDENEDTTDESYLDQQTDNSNSKDEL